MPRSQEKIAEERKGGRLTGNKNLYFFYTKIERKGGGRVVGGLEIKCHFSEKKLNPAIFLLFFILMLDSFETLIIHFSILYSRINSQC